MMQPSHQDPSLRIARKLADYYHVAPTTERNRILQHGLQPSQPMLNDQWGSEQAWQDRHGLNPQIPTGVYGWPSSGQAYDFAQRNEIDTPMDVWRMPNDPERLWHEDPDIQMSNPERQPRVTPTPVMDPELLEGPEHRDWDPIYDRYEKKWYDRSQNDYRDFALNKDTNPNYEELWNQRVAPE
jgi:hypothetical protein